jgi:hypothetical protein
VEKEILKPPLWRGRRAGCGLAFVFAISTRCCKTVANLLRNRTKAEVILHRVKAVGRARSAVNGAFTCVKICVSERNAH